MKNLFRVIFALILCSSGTSLYSQWDCNECCQPESTGGGFYVGGYGMWAVPTETGLGTFTDSWQYLDADGGVTALSKPSKAKYEAAWGIRAGYDFPCSQNNVEVEYFHLDNKKHNVNDTSDGPISFGSAFFNLGIPLAPGEVFISDSHLKYTFNQVDVKFGHRFNDCISGFRFLPSLGVRFVDIKHDLTFLVGNVKTEYQGAGPLVSFDADYQLFNNFYLVGRFDAAAMMGTVKANSLLTFAAINRYKSPSTDRIVSALGGKLGVAYEYQFCNQSSVRLEAGYKVANYHGPFDVISAFVIDVPRIGNLNTTNFGYSGAYIELSWHM